MASKSKHQGVTHDEGLSEIFLDILTKEEKEALLNKKMEEIRKKNEALQRRHAEIEADRRAAEKMGRAVSLKPTSPISGDIPMQLDSAELSESPAMTGDRSQPDRRRTGGRPRPEHRPRPDQNRANRPRGEPNPNGRPRSDHNMEHRPNEQNLDHRPRSEPHRKDTRPRPEQNWANQSRPAQSNRDNHPRQAETAKGNEKEFGQKRQNDRDEENTDDADHSNMKGVATKEAHPSRTAGRGKRLTQMSQQKLKAQEYEKAKRKVTETDQSAPPPDPGYSFLADHSREKSVPEPHQGDYTRRHPRNFGGTNFENVKNKIKVEKEKQGRFRSGPQTEMDMSLQMTGRERREYSSWRTEREQIDKERLQRHKNSEGTWRRAWDADKKEQTVPTPPMSRKMEPGRRPEDVDEHKPSQDHDRDHGQNYGREQDYVHGRGQDYGRGRDHGRDRGRGGSRGDRGGSRGGRPNRDQAGPSGRPDYQRSNHRGNRDNRQFRGSNDSMDRSFNQHDSRSPKLDNVERSPKRFRNLSHGSDDGTRHVKERNDYLVVKIDNEFASSKPGGKAFGGFQGSTQEKNFSFQSPTSPTGQGKFGGFHGNPAASGEHVQERGRGRGRGDRGRGRDQRRRSVDRWAGKSERPGRAKTVTFQAEPVIHTPELEWELDTDNVLPTAAWQQDLAAASMASSENWGKDAEHAKKVWEMDTPIPKEQEGEFIEDHYIAGHEEIYPEVKKPKNKTKKMAKSPPKTKRNEWSGFVDENGDPVKDDGEWIDEDGVLAGNEGDFDEKNLHDSSAESLERFIQEHTLQLNIDEKTGDISLENSMPSSQQTSSSHSTPTQRSPPSHRSSPSQCSPRSGESPPSRRYVATRQLPLRAKSLPPLTITCKTTPTAEDISKSQPLSPSEADKSQENSPVIEQTASQHTPPAQTPTSPENLFIKTPVGFVKVLDWGAEVDRFLDGSQGSSPTKSAQDVSDTSLDISGNSALTDTPTKDTSMEDGVKQLEDSVEESEATTNEDQFKADASLEAKADSGTKGDDEKSVTKQVGDVDSKSEREHVGEDEKAETKEVESVDVSVKPVGEHIVESETTNEGEINSDVNLREETTSGLKYDEKKPDIAIENAASLVAEEQCAQASSTTTTTEEKPDQETDDKTEDTSSGMDQANLSDNSPPTEESTEEVNASQAPSSDYSTADDDNDNSEKFSETVTGENKTEVSEVEKENKPELAASEDEIDSLTMSNIVVGESALVTSSEVSEETKHTLLMAKVEPDKIATSDETATSAESIEMVDKCEKVENTASNLTVQDFTDGKTISPVEKTETEVPPVQAETQTESLAEQ